MLVFTYKLQVSLTAVIQDLVSILSHTKFSSTCILHKAFLVGIILIYTMYQLGFHLRLLTSNKILKLL